MHILLARALQGAAVAVVITLCRVLLYVFNCYRAHRRYCQSAVPGPPKKHAILGHIPDISGPKGVFVLSEWANQFGPVYKMQFLDQYCVVCSDPDLAARITRRTGPGPYMPKPRFLYEALETAVTPKLPSILTAPDGEYWKAVRQGAAPCFSISNMRKVLPLVVELTQRVSDRMQPVVDITDCAKRITSDIMGQLLLGEDLGGTRWEPSEYLDVFYPVVKAQAELLNNPLHLWQLWRSDVRYARHCLKIHDRLMGQKAARLMSNPPPDYTIAAHLLDVKDPATGKRLTVNQLKAEIAIFMSAGFETTSHGISWTLALLAAHPEIQDELFLELEAARIAPSADGNSPGRSFEASDLGRLPVLSAVIKESLRVCPPAPFGGSRICPTDNVDLCGHTIHKGTVVMMSTLPIALSKHNFGLDAAEFKPSRWLPGSSLQGREQPLHGGDDDTGPVRDSAEAGAAQSGLKAAAATAGPSALPDPMTFLLGPRDCIGQNLAKLELQVVVAMLVARFQFSPGADLQRELEVAAATGQPRLSAVHALTGVHVTLQPLSGQVLLGCRPRQQAPAR